MLTAAYEQGCVRARARFGVKLAAVPLARPMPAAQGLATAHPTMATTPQPGYALTPHEEAHAQQLRSMSHTQRQDALGLNPPPAPAPTPTAPAAPAGPSRMQQFMRPVKRGLGLAALGAAGATAYGLHQQNERDQEGRNLVYAPMGGT